MFGKIQVKTKFLLPMSILILAFLMLTMSLITIYYSKANSLLELQKSVVFATKISQLVHSTQKERGYSSGYVTSKGKKFKEELLEQRLVTDARIKILQNYLPKFKTIKIKSINDALVYVAKLHNVRQKIDRLNISNRTLINFYSNMNDKFIDVIVELSKYSKVPKITQNLIAYSDFLYAKENAGIERAFGTIILTQNFITFKQRIYFNTLVDAQNLYLKTFFKYVSEDAKAFYQRIAKSPEFREVQYFREKILTQNKNFGIDVKKWFTTLTKKIDKLDKVDHFLEQEVLKNIQNELQNTYKYFAFFVFLNIVGIVIFVSVIILILDLIKNERRLKNINYKYVISSITDTEGKIIEVSDAFCNISQYKREELIGKTHALIRHPDMPKSFFTALWNTIKSGKHWQGKIKNQKKDGSYFWLYTDIEPLFDRNGKVEAYAAVRVDVTDSIELREELERSKAKDEAMLQQSKLAQMGEMIAMIAHQWRQPLTAISSISSDLYMKIMLNKYNESYFNKKLEKIDDLSQHLSKTIDDFRGFYKDDKEKILIDFSELARGALDIASASIETKHIELVTDCKAKEKMLTYPNELRQVIINFIKNAEDVLIEREVENASIKIVTYDDESFSYLEVHDNAGGVPKEILDKIFEPYFSTKIKKDGTGLGLYMSKTIIEDHCHGEISVFNTKAGAVFQIKIPIKGA